MRPADLPDSVYVCTHIWSGIHMHGLLSGSVVKKRNPPAIAGGMGSIPALGRYPGAGNDNQLQYSCLGNSMDRGA